MRNAIKHIQAGEQTRQLRSKQLSKVILVVKKPFSYTLCNYFKSLRILSLGVSACNFKGFYT